ncbi:hypothetical protein B0H13DRAFT_2687793 [Mycena leptocephala]|nr:hypothetical protein B0H13DRAFT_2687793 [Mycena leptocephala]
MFAPSSAANVARSSDSELLRPLIISCTGTCNEVWRRKRRREFENEEDTKKYTHLLPRRAGGPAVCARAASVSCFRLRWLRPNNIQPFPGNVANILEAKKSHPPPGPCVSSPLTDVREPGHIRDRPELLPDPERRVRLCLVQHHRLASCTTNTLNSTSISSAAGWCKWKRRVRRPPQERQRIREAGRRWGLDAARVAAYVADVVRLCVAQCARHRAVYAACQTVLYRLTIPPAAGAYV